MIRKARIRFIILSMVAVFILLAAVLAAMNISNYRTQVAEADNILYLVANNGGEFPDIEGMKRTDLPQYFSPESPYEYRYFSVLLDDDYSIIQVDTNRIISVNQDQAIEYALQVLSAEKDKGFIDIYRYMSYREGILTRITFLNCEQKLNYFRSYLTISSAIVFIGYIIFFFVIVFFSKRIMQPVAESYEKQKQFITDAGHEIKTPLTIINADVDVLKMDIGENEWLSDIEKQAERLTGLTNDLVYLSRMEESDNSLTMIEFPFSDTVTEAASSFQALAQMQNKKFLCDIQPMLSVEGNEKAVRQLVEILLDNALKYSPENGTVSVYARKQNKAVLLSVYNTTDFPIKKEDLKLLFERFFRTDPSRSLQTGGYGIGLSVAKAIMSAHGGKIYAETAEDGMSLTITAVFPH